VADPAAAPPEPTLIYAHPDDIIEDGKPWRDKLREYNRLQDSNWLGLHSA
jgi:hypothetical protein